MNDNYENNAEEFDVFIGTLVEDDNDFYFEFNSEVCCELAG